jgi:hypothetical protein
MLGLNLAVRLGRTLLAGPLEDSGLLPRRYYRHQALMALEDEDFPAALRYLELARPAASAKTRLLTQMAVLRLRLLKERHARQRQEWLSLRGALTPDRLMELLKQEDIALSLLAQYESAALHLAQAKTTA